MSDLVNAEVQPDIPTRVVVATPFAGKLTRNILYAQRAMKDSLQRGEAPFLSHLLYPQVLRDDIIAERTLGLKCERAFLRTAELLAVYIDLGVSEGMQLTIVRARSWGIAIEERRLP